ncbi:MAG TPA: heparan-alpha-glucosaminide N-acetyltransferase domain-containing protein [Gemmatimonadales bacterium]|nr:heparan-alpha-glucosaminide N-acetyltransferase domain-containing protein [Gemmatimonadales bacterium]
MTDQSPPRRVRIESVDLVRGIIMILMALDHVRDFFGALGANPTDLATTTPGLFLTRWITHICAPVFFLLTGTGAWFSGRRRSRNGLAQFLLTRGLWLILLELTVMRFLLQFNVDYTVTIITVLWALGWSMIVLAGLIYLPTWLIAVIGSVMIAEHNLLDSVQASSFGALAPLWNVLHGPGFLVNNEQHVVLVSYALIPWVGVTALGYVLGQLYHWDAERRRKWLLGLGLGLTAGFVILRFINVYGDPVPWSPQESPVFTVLSFMNANKYPPSLLFLLMTLGPALLLLRAFDGGMPSWLRPVLVYGKVPLFYFILHFLLIHLLAVAAAWIRFGDVSGLFQSPSLDRFPFTAPPGWPASLPVIYLIWAGVVVALYPVCRWYAGVKARRRDWWMSYL